MWRENVQLGMPFEMGRLVGVNPGDVVLQHGCNQLQVEDLASGDRMRADQLHQEGRNFGVMARTTRFWQVS